MKKLPFRRSKDTWITPSEVMEYLFCPRFIYFMNCLKIPQNEEQRYKVQMGRNIHKIKERINKQYLRKKIGVIEKEIDVYLASQEWGIRGIIDEILFFEDGTMAPLDYKFSEYKGKIFDTYYYQSLMYAILIEENYQKEVHNGYVVYTRSKNRLLKIEWAEKTRQNLSKILNNMFEIIELGKFPKKTKNRNQCIDCCYKNICV